MDKCFCPKAWNYYVFSLILFQYSHYELYTCVGVFFSCNDMAKNTSCETTPFTETLICSCSQKTTPDYNTRLVLPRVYSTRLIIIPSNRYGFTGDPTNRDDTNWQSL